MSHEETWVLVSDNADMVDFGANLNLPLVRVTCGEGTYASERPMLFTKVFSHLRSTDARLVLVFRFSAVWMAESIPLDLSYASYFRRRGAFPFCIRLCDENTSYTRLGQYYALKALNKEAVLARGVLMRNPYDFAIQECGASLSSIAALLMDRQQQPLIEFVRKSCVWKVDPTLRQLEPVVALDPPVSLGPIEIRLREPNSDYRAVSDEDGPTTLGLCHYLQRVGRTQEAASIAASCTVKLPEFFKIRAVAASAAGRTDEARALFLHYKQQLLNDGSIETLSSLELNDCASAALLNANLAEAHKFALLSVHRNPFASPDPYRTLMLLSERGHSSPECEQSVFEYLAGLQSSRRTVQYYSTVCSQAAHPMKALRLFYFSQYLVFHDHNKARKLLEQAMALLREPYEPWASHIFCQYGHLIHSVPAYRTHRNAREPLEKALQISPTDPLCQSVYASFLLISGGERERGLEYAKLATESEELWNRVSAYFMIASHVDQSQRESGRLNLAACIRLALESQLAIPALFLDDHAQHCPTLVPLLDALKSRKKNVILEYLNKN